MRRPNLSGIYKVIIYNWLTPRIEKVGRFQIGRLEVKGSWRSTKNLWGRFGGGWNWKLGVQAGGKTVLVSLVIFEITFNWRSDVS